MARSPWQLMGEEAIRKLPLPERACGTCTLCCTLMRIEDDDKNLVSDWMKPCEHLCKGGCGIYETRPTSCKVFECVWLASQRFPETAMKKSERPDRSGIVIDVNTKGTIIVHCQTPQAYKRPENWKLLYNRFVLKGEQVTIEHGNGEVSVVESDGSLTTLTFIGMDPETGENMYKRKA